MVRPSRERERHIPSPSEIESAKTPAGGWTRATLATWGVSWPPRRGWRAMLEEEYERHSLGRADERAIQPAGRNGVLDAGEDAGGMVAVADGRLVGLLFRDGKIVR